MPAATILLFILAGLILAVTIVIFQKVNDGGEAKLSPPDVFASQQAAKTATPGGQQTQPPPATQTAQAQNQQSVTPGTGTPATRTGTPATGTPGAGGKTYTVKAGDTCGKIAADNNITLQQLMDANKITNPECPINVGDVLKLP